MSTPTENRRAKALEYALEFYRGRVVPHATIIGAAAVFDDFLSTGAGAPGITIKVEGDGGVSANEIHKALLKLKRHNSGTDLGLS